MERQELGEFGEVVLEIARLIPRGRATSYGAIARAIGYPNHSRMVGKIVNGCGPDIPAHRIVDSQGRLSGSKHFDSPSAMAERLEREGVKVSGGRIADFRHIFWDPQREL